MFAVERNQSGEHLQPLPAPGDAAGILNLKRRVAGVPIVVNGDDAVVRASFRLRLVAVDVERSAAGERKFDCLTRLFHSQQRNNRKRACQRHIYANKSRPAHLCEFV